MKALLSNKEREYLNLSKDSMETLTVQPLQDSAKVHWNQNRNGIFLSIFRWFIYHTYHSL